MAGRPHNEALARAKLMGDKTYQGVPHGPCGTTERYTSSNSCVFCARQRMKGKRAEFDKYLKQTLTDPDPLD